MHPLHTPDEATAHTVESSVLRRAEVRRALTANFAVAAFVEHRRLLTSSFVVEACRGCDLGPWLASLSGYVDR